MNLFEEAIKKDELFEFAQGKNQYFILDREYGEHWIHSSWVNHILPLINEQGEDNLNPQILNLFKSILNSEILELEKKGDLILYHLHVYYYLRNDGKIRNNIPIMLNAEIRVLLENYMDYLVKTNSNKIGAVRNAIQLIKTRGYL